MARISRIVVPGMPHHITQRGNRRQQTFFCEADYALYLQLMADACAEFSVEIWAYCLMPNHAHLIAVPAEKESLRLAIGRAHQRYTARVNRRMEWTGCLWQGRFASFVLDDPYLWEATRYVELNPVRAGLASCPEEWPWSSARAHLTAQDDVLACCAPLLERFGDWRVYLAQIPDEQELHRLRSHARTGRPLGGVEFLEHLEATLLRAVKRRKPGPKSTIESPDHSHQSELFSAER